MSQKILRALPRQLQRRRTRPSQQIKSKINDDKLSMQIILAALTMARIGVPASDVSDILCRALQNQYTQKRHLRCFLLT